MKRILLGMGVVLATIGIAFAVNTYVYKDGVGNLHNFFDFGGPFPSTEYSAQVLIDSGGNEKGLTANPVSVLPVSQYPDTSTAIANSATGGALATATTLTATSAVTNFLCGFSIRANAAAVATGNATVAGIVSGNLNFMQWTAPTTGIGTIEENFNPCLQASAVNTGIVVTSAAPGSGGTVSVTAWGYRK